MHIEIFEPSHYHKIKPLGGWKPLKYISELLFTSLQSHHAKGYTIVDKGKIVCILAIHIFYPGRGEISTIMCEDIKKHSHRFCDLLKKSLPVFMKALGLRRLEATVYTNHKSAIRLNEWIGFKKECMMKKASPEGKDMYLYSVVEGE